MRKVLFYLGEVSDQDVEWMISAGRKESVPEGQVLIHEGTPIDAVYIVLTGTLSISVAALGNRQLNRVGCGEILGEMSFIDARPPSATVTALDDAIVFAIPRSLLAAQLAQDTGFAARFYRAISLFLSDRLRSSVMRLGYGEGLDEKDVYVDELNPSVLENIHLAGSRFDRMLKRLIGS